MDRQPCLCLMWALRSHWCASSQSTYFLISSWGQELHLRPELSIGPLHRIEKSSQSVSLGFTHHTSHTINDKVYLSASWHSSTSAPGFRRVWTFHIAMFVTILRSRDDASVLCPFESVWVVYFAAVSFLTSQISWDQAVSPILARQFAGLPPMLTDWLPANPIGTEVWFQSSPSPGWTALTGLVSLIYPPSEAM